ncbi:hypothetical protein L249_8699 [Ophiocordyceps polyrhachis-furcata BCC 54312]|uniref:Uncharacterized protein n=1 Tax=Ophiocordyceps polyrhachis-furcata BCC 54312 TaxID=1330021 RepID=A0A367L6I5_9HYPO|nr:hypothetical protein L249_8699 [Ophiocordyceps polyrhachis-furcata BCC 54312]
MVVFSKEVGASPPPSRHPSSLEGYRHHHHHHHHHHQPSDLTSARLTPSPHCSPSLKPVHHVMLDNHQSDDDDDDDDDGHQDEDEDDNHRWNPCHQWQALNLIPLDPRWAFDTLKGSA